MIDFASLKIDYDPPKTNCRYAAWLRFIDTDDPDKYDKGATVADNSFKSLIERAEWRATVVCSAPDPYDIAALDEAFQQAEH